MSSVFASYVTGSAFRIDLSRRMVSSLMAAANGGKLNTGNYGTESLIKRGLMEITEGQEKRIYKNVRLTEAGFKVAELCTMAGLGGGE
ncbi:hypothetical protein [Allorhizobium borbori]|uniref:Putative transcriptional regulator with HTH domain n=1 Tax=Allorhizobium borbori TaxID=485907 RepID=A0A7W6K3U2_9HYPH|nr:hypothetical protein [Allorhizobium borbori]MBB4103550.1 putative transcriptional regulator with HTH domain [Allorhizobium borbori]